MVANLHYYYYYWPLVEEIVQSLGDRFLDHFYFDYFYFGYFYWDYSDKLFSVNLANQLEIYLSNVSIKFLIQSRHCYVLQADRSLLVHSNDYKTLFGHYLHFFIFFIHGFILSIPFDCLWFKVLYDVSCKVASVLGILPTLSWFCKNRKIFSCIHRHLTTKTSSNKY